MLNGSDLVNGLDRVHWMAHIQQMLNGPSSVNAVEERAATALKELLLQVPAISADSLAVEASQWRDFVVRIVLPDGPHTLICEVKPVGQPRHVREAVAQLRSYIADGDSAATPVVIAPYLSSEAQALCREKRVGFLDLEGNARLAFGTIFIERHVDGKPAAERRVLRSLFKPKSAQVLRTLLRNPRKAWRVAALASAADVSAGHVSNVRHVLLDREWAKDEGAGLHLTEPAALLDAWREAYESPPGRRLFFYSALHGQALDKAVRRGLAVGSLTGHASLASFSAAQWLAPYARNSTQYFYADAAALDALRAELHLASVAKGSNVVISVVNDDGFFRDTVEPAKGIVCTSAVQTYLDLAVAGERGQEAADHLRREILEWQF